jgi:dihydrofolate synthase/folylpolyglutamate synthase
LDYQATLEYLYSLTDYEKERLGHYDSTTLDLSRVQRTLARLGNPHQRYRAVHVAGTKGKGSVAAMCASALRSAGLRTGLYTSPHLHTFCERIQVDGELIPRQALVELLRDCRPAFDAEPELTTFEAITSLAFLYFQRRQLDVAVVEVGLGGRLDATNVITPQVAVITSLSYDHTYWLGHTLAEIAWEKAGIVKPGVPTVCAPQSDEALEVVQQVCAERESPLTLVGRDWTWQLNGPLLEGQSFDLRHAPGTSDLDGPYTIPLLGRHQIHNAVATIAALDGMRRAGVSLQPRHIRQGLAGVRWPGRFEVLRREPPLVMDCAHNGDSMARLVTALGAWFPARRWTFVLGISKDKDLPAILRALSPWTERLLATRSRHARAMPPAQLAELASEVLPHVRQVEDVSAALALALEGGGPVCVTGSIFVVAEALEAWALCTGGDPFETDPA